MNKKRIIITLSVLLIISIFASSIPVTATEKNISSIGNRFRFGAFLLTCTNIDGLDLDYHIGGLSNLNITAISKEFMIATYPIWGTTIIEEEAEIHITIENFFGLIQTNSQGYIEIMGICKNIAWELK